MVGVQHGAVLAPEQSLHPSSSASKVMSKWRVAPGRFQAQPGGVQRADGH
jgi:hypothetical protein